MVRPLKAAMVFSTKPDSFSVSVWIATWTSVSSATARQAVDGGGRGAPVLVQLEAAGAGQHLLDQRVRRRRVALAEEADVHRQAVGGLQHAARGARAPGVQVVALVPSAGPVPPPSMVVMPE